MGERRRGEGRKKRGERGGGERKRINKKSERLLRD